MNRSPLWGAGVLYQRILVGRLAGGQPTVLVGSRLDDILMLGERNVLQIGRAHV